MKFFDREMVVTLTWILAGEAAALAGQWLLFQRMLGHL